MSLQGYPVYKSSGVEWLGDVPEGWEVKRLKRICDTFASNVDKKSYENQKTVFLCNYVDVYYNDEITESIDFMVATASPEEINKFSLMADNVIITKDSESPDDIGIPAYIPRNIENVICGYHLSIIRPKNHTYGLFIKYFFESNYLRSKFATLANGLTRFGLSQGAINNVEIAYPPFREQTQIANFLDHETAKIDTLIAEQKRLISLLKEKRQAVISHAVTKGLDPNVTMKDSGVEWLGDVPEGWEVKRLKYVSEIIDCKNRTPEYFDDGEYLVVRTSNVKQLSIITDDAFYTNEEMFIEWTKRGIPKVGTVLFTREAPAGEVALVPENMPLCLGQRMMNINPDINKLISTFLVYFIYSHAVRDYIALCSSGSTVTHLRVGQVYDLVCVLPSVVEQNEIVNFLDQETAKLDALEQEAQTAINLLKERRSALISAAVTGKIDLRNWQAP